MMIICPNCEKEYGADPGRPIATDLIVSCRNCDGRFTIQARYFQRIVCPNCGNHQEKGTECQKCGVVFAKLKEEEFISESSDGNDTQLASPETEKRHKLFNTWIKFSIIYLICVLIYSVVIFPNERDRPYRDRFISTIHLIEYSDFEREVEAIKFELENMIIRRERKSAIYEILESYSRILDRGVSIRKSKAMIRARFSNGTILKYVDHNFRVYLIKTEIPHRDRFTVFPSFTELHTVYKEIDYDEKAIELQEAYDDIDFSLIEYKFKKCAKWFIPRFILLVFLIWGLPVCLGFLAVCFKIRVQHT